MYARTRNALPQNCQNDRNIGEKCNEAERGIRPHLPEVDLKKGKQNAGDGNQTTRPYNFDHLSSSSSSTSSPRSDSSFVVSLIIVVMKLSRSLRLMFADITYSGANVAFDFEIFLPMFLLRFFKLLDFFLQCLRDAFSAVSTQIITSI